MSLAPPILLAHPGVFLVGFEIEAHEHVIVGDGLHVFHVIGKTGEGGEAEHAEHFHRRGLFADEFGFNFFEAKVTGQIEDFADKSAGQAATAILGMDQHADAANVPLPATELLVQSGVADNLAVAAGEQGQVASQINLLAPFMDDIGIGDFMFDEHALLSRHGEKKLVESDFIGGFERAQLALKTALQLDRLWVLFSE